MKTQNLINITVIRDYKIQIIYKYCKNKTNMKKIYTTLFATALITGLNAQTALTFDGTDDYVDFGTATAFAIAGDLTIEAKVKTPTAVTDYYPVVNNSYENASGFYEGYWLGIDDLGYATLFLGDAVTAGDGYYVTGTTLIDDGLWHHITGVVANASSAQPTAMIYVDGVLETTLMVPNLNISSTGIFYIGADDEGYYHQGEIDNVRLWNIALSGSEISQYQNICLLGNENGLEALYQFDTGSSTVTVHDVTANGNDGTMTLMDQNASWVTGFNCTITGIETNELNQNNIYPNPFEDSFTLQLSENTTYPITAEVIDYLGRKVHSQVIESATTEIALKELAKGTYSIKVFNETTQAVERIMKLK